MKSLLTMLLLSPSILYGIQDDQSLIGQSIPLEYIYEETQSLSSEPSDSSLFLSKSESTSSIPTITIESSDSKDKKFKPPVLKRQEAVIGIKVLPIEEESK